MKMCHKLKFFTNDITPAFCSCEHGFENAFRINASKMFVCRKCGWRWVDLYESKRL